MTPKTPTTRNQTSIHPDEVTNGIDRLNGARAVFCLKALMLAGHVSNDHVWAVLKLCDTVKFSEEY